MIHAVFFDAVGTLLEPHPAAVAVYHTVAQAHGSALALPEIARRFRAAFRHEEESDRRNDWRTDEAREERRWRAIVTAVLDDVTEPEVCFRELWDHFGRPGAWRCPSGIETTLTALAQRGLQLGLASNFDARLRGVIQGLPGLEVLTHLVISSEVGWRKPAAAFFRRVVAAAEVPPEAILFVGDDPINDDAGATRAGLRSLLVAPMSDGETLRSAIQAILEEQP